MRKIVCKNKDIAVSYLSEGDTCGNTAMFQGVLDGNFWAHVGGEKQAVGSKCGQEVVQARSGTICGGVNPCILSALRNDLVSKNVSKAHIAMRGVAVSQTLPYISKKVKSG
jgi:hypothetical protein